MSRFRSDQPSMQSLSHPASRGGAEVHLGVDLTKLRLVLVKHVLRKVRVTARAADPLSRIMAIQLSDFAIETLMKTAIQSKGRPSDYLGPPGGYSTSLKQLRKEKYRHDAPFPRVFDELVAIYHDPVKEIPTDSPPYRAEISQIHEARNTAQHEGVVPSIESVESALATAEAFVSAILRDVFRLSLKEVSLPSLVRNVPIRMWLERAEGSLEAQDYGEALTQAANAFHIALDVETETVRQAREFRAGLKPIDYLDSRRVDTEVFPGLGQTVSDMHWAVEELRNEVGALLSGVNARQYVRFLSVTPRVGTRGQSGEVDPAGAFWSAPPPDWNPNEADAIDALDFVESTVLEWGL